MGDRSEYPVHTVDRPVMFQGWDDLTFLHWRYRPEVVRPLIPPHLEVETFDGSAWIGLTPFRLTRLRPPWLPALPWISSFPEMNIRTYVRDRGGGESGIWFFSLEAARLAAVIGARVSYGLPYRWAKMYVRRDGERVHYASRRHAGPGSARIAVGIGSAIGADAETRFLTARFRLYTTLFGRPAYAQVDHPPWPLHAADVLHVEQDVIQCSGLPAPSGKPLAHFSPGVYVRIGPPVLFVGQL